VYGSSPSRQRRSKSRSRGTVPLSIWWAHRRNVQSPRPVIDLRKLEASPPDRSAGGKKVCSPSSSAACQDRRDASLAFSPTMMMTRMGTHRSAMSGRRSCLIDALRNTVRTHRMRDHERPDCRKESRSRSENVAWRAMCRCCGRPVGTITTDWVRALLVDRRRASFQKASGGAFGPPSRVHPSPIAIQPCEGW
jgi:hypothetical protein